MRDVPNFKTEEYNWVGRFIEIDFLAIDDEISQMSSLIDKCGECSSQANEIRDAAKEDLDYAKATAADKLRKLPTTNGKERSETAITSQIALDEDYSIALVDLREARLDASLWASRLAALQAKSYSLRIAGDLIMKEYITRDYLMNKRRAEIRNVKVGS